MVCSIPIVAQDFPLQSRTISPIKTDSLYFIGEWVMESSLSVKLNNEELSTEAWVFDSVNGVLRFIDKEDIKFEQFDRAVVYYRLYPYSLKRVYRNPSITELDSSILMGKFNEPNSQNYSENQNSFSNLSQSGSLSRGIIVGTNQDFALESGLNFELKGQLTENVFLNAVLTDKSIPIQPDGTTQNLKEFDKVFIQVESPNSRLEMGDVDLSFQKTTFARINRRLQGATGYNSNKYSNVAAAASVVRGVYKRVNLDGVEGVQGPYRLTGNRNDEFVMVLAGTERVYLNGQEIQRGEDRDYIIDYGLGEIQFTNNRLIKDETRIVVEYEYIDQNFNRTLVAGEAESSFLNNKLQIGATIIRQSDGDNLLSQRTLTESDIDLLKLAGDNLDNAQVSGAIEVNPNDEANVLYAKIDTTSNGQTYTIYKNKPGNVDAKFRVQFSNVGSMKGSYQRIGNTINGLVYEWVGPNGGSYEPFRNLPAPELQLMAALNGAYSVNKTIRIFGEWAVSDLDKNRFSDLDEDDNTDLAYLGGFEINKLPAGPGLLSIEAQRRYSGKNFEYFERTQEVEFDRKWNIENLTNSQEATNEVKASYLIADRTKIGGEFGKIERANFNGTRQASSFNTSTKKDLNLSYAQDWVTSTDGALNIDGKWFKQQGEVSSPVFDSEALAIKPYVSFEQERRIQKKIGTDSLTNQSLKFYEISPGIQFSTSKWTIDYSIGFRDESRVKENELIQEFSALQQTVKVDYTPSIYFNTRNKITLRDKNISEEFSTAGNSAKKALLIRSNTDYKTSKESWSGNLLYEVNTQRQSLLQEAYIEVGPEIGQFTWTDLNNDGVEQVDEFFPELTPNEGTYLRQFLPSDELLPVIDLRARLRNKFIPFSFLANQELGWTDFFSQIIFNSRFDVSENSTTQNLDNVYLLRLNTFRDSMYTISGRLSLEKELDVLPAYTNYDLIVRYNQTRSLNKRSSELQKNFLDAMAGEFSYNISRIIDGSTKIIRSTNRVISNAIANRNFDIKSNSVEQSVNITINRSWRTGMAINYTQKRDEFISNSATEAEVVKIRNTNRFFLLRKVQANSTFEIRNVSIKGGRNALSNYELTEGAGRGFNVLWSLNSSYRVNNLLRFNLAYDGRTVSDRPTIHTARLTVKATF